MRLTQLLSQLKASVIEVPTGIGIIMNFRLQLQPGIGPMMDSK